MTVHELAYFLHAKRFARAHSYDEVAALLFVSAHSHEDHGVTEKQIAEGVGLTRATTNRLVRKMIDDRKLVRITGKRPFQYIYNMEFTKEAYGSDAERVRAEFYLATFSKYAEVSRLLIKTLAKSQFETD